MNPCALWRWIGSLLPGGYSTVIIRPSFPGHSFRSFVINSVTLASCAAIVVDMRHASAKISFVNINKPSLEPDAFHASSLVFALHYALCIADRRQSVYLPVPCSPGQTEPAHVS